MSKSSRRRRRFSLARFLLFLLCRPVSERILRFRFPRARVTSACTLAPPSLLTAKPCAFFPNTPTSVNSTALSLTFGASNEEDDDEDEDEEENGDDEDEEGAADDDDEDGEDDDERDAETGGEAAQRKSEVDCGARDEANFTGAFRQETPFSPGLFPAFLVSKVSKSPSRIMEWG